MIKENQTKNSNKTQQKYQGEILVDCQANTHFIIDEFKNSYAKESMLKEQEISSLKNQANQVLNATREYLKLQANKQETSTSEFREKREREDTLFEWWML